MQLLEKLTEHAKRTPEAVAVWEVARGGGVTWRELAESVATTAAVISGAVEPGEVVLLVCPNDARFVVAFLAVLAAGGRVFPVSVESTAAELREAAGRSGAVGMIGAAAALAAVDVERKFALPDVFDSLQNCEPSTPPILARPHPCPLPEGEGGRALILDTC
jgi:acyl-CoA synthetase (AMP-forming)/AMP-acid ligase II